MLLYIFELFSESNFLQECTSEKFTAMMNTQYPNFKYQSDKLEDIFESSYTESGAFDELVEVVNNGRPGYEGRLSLHKICPIKEFKLTINTDITAHLDSVHKKGLSNAEKLRAIFDGIDKLSAKEDIYWHLKMSMLYHRAKKEKYVAKLLIYSYKCCIIITNSSSH